MYKCKYSLNVIRVLWSKRTLIVLHSLEIPITKYNLGGLALSFARYSRLPYK